VHPLTGTKPEAADRDKGFLLHTTAPVPNPTGPDAYTLVS